MATSGSGGGRRSTEWTESGLNSCVVRPNGGDFSIVAACFPQSRSVA